MAVDDNGRFTDRITDFREKYVKDADNDITQAVKVRESSTFCGTIFLNKSG